ncbi:MAG: type I methionyl aminopeptidase [Candidatus Nealsonbacteria bacterium DGGOD1a]|nr:MAG: type I methionyl aminopeptidase [Candidatus Nealsonbacteria bacterium DGGOD1a]
MIYIKTPKDLEIIAQGGKLLASVLARLKDEVKIGIATKEIDNLAEKLIFECGGKPSFSLPENSGGGGFPAATCVSINDEVVHGIPSERIVKDGDLVTVDVGMVYKGFHTDTALSVAVGEAAPETRRMLRITKKALKYAIKKSRAGNTFGDVGNTIERYVESQGFHVISDLCGHGIGKSLHEDPQVMNYGRRHKGPAIKVGMVFCPEPMVTAGNPDIYRDKNGWTYRVKDGGWAAHFEHTIAIFPDGARILTKIDEPESPNEDEFKN